jgi:hypothetical protein
VFNKVSVSTLMLVLSKWSKLYDMQGYDQGKADMVLLR